MGDVIVFAAVWLLTLTALMLDFAGILRRGTFWRLQGTGLLLMFSVLLISTFARYLGWSIGWVHPLMWPAILAGLVFVISGLVVEGRKRRRAPRAGYPDE
jgi:uncharacterized membrane protein YhaH (DUF805 family)